MIMKKNMRTVCGYFYFIANTRSLKEYFNKAKILVPFHKLVLGQVKMSIPAISHDGGLRAAF